MAEFLMEVKHKGYKLAVASASKNAPIILERLGIADMFDAVVDPAALKSGKPDPEIFVRAAELMNLQPCEVIAWKTLSRVSSQLMVRGKYRSGSGTKMNFMKRLSTLPQPRRSAFLPFRVIHIFLDQICKISIVHLRKRNGYFFRKGAVQSPF